VGRWPMAAADRGPASGRASKSTAFPKRREGVATQIADGEAVLLDIEGGEYFSLNPVGSRIWELCDGTRSTAEIVSVICDEFDVAEDVAMADAGEILDELEKEKLVET
jgi:Coenzyme PQQ synthesis protein D (PqqD)